MRHTWEEIGIDLAENDYTAIGQLDDREITTSLGKRLLMILSPFGTSSAARPQLILESDDLMHDADAALPQSFSSSPHTRARSTPCLR